MSRHIYPSPPRLRRLIRSSLFEGPSEYADSPNSGMLSQPYCARRTLVSSGPTPTKSKGNKIKLLLFSRIRNRRKWSTYNKEHVGDGPYIIENSGDPDVERKRLPVSLYSPKKMEKQWKLNRFEVSQVCLQLQSAVKSLTDEQVARLNQERGSYIRRNCQWQGTQVRSHRRGSSW